MSRIKLTPFKQPSTNTTIEKTMLVVEFGVELNLVNLLLFKWVGTGRGWGAVVLDKYTNSR